MDPARSSPAAAPAGSILAAYAAVLVAITSIQCGASLAKSIFPQVGPGGATALRLGWASVMLAIAFRPWRVRVPRAQLGALALYGGSLGLMNLSYYFALQRIPLGIAVALEFTGPLSVAALASRRAVDFVWALLAAAGILLILPLPSLGSVSIDPLGAALALVAGGFWALYIVFGQRAGAGLSGGRATAIGMLAATAVAFPPGAWQAGSRLLDLSILPAALGVALFSSALPYSLEMIGLQRLPRRTFGILMSLEPAIAALSGLAFLGERLAPAQWLAIALVMAASAGSAACSRAELPA